MARRAVRDTFAYERVGMAPGDETEVRRQVFAGHAVPEHWRVEDEGALEGVDGPPMVGLGAAPAHYKHQLDDRGQVREEHATGPGTNRQTTDERRRAQRAPKREGAVVDESRVERNPADGE